MSPGRDALVTQQALHTQTPHIQTLNIQASHTQAPHPQTPHAWTVTTDGPLPETSDLVAGWYLVDVDSHERAVEIAAHISSEPGPGGEPLYEWIDVREVMSGMPAND